MTPADELRAAADKLRTLATAASTDTDGTPTVNWNTKRNHFVGSDQQTYDHSRLYGDYIINGRGERAGWPLLLRGGGPRRAAYMHTQHAEYAAAMDPTVGLAVAVWLEAEAATWAGDEVHTQCTPALCTLDAALAVARALLGSREPAHD
ncbi:hypothetical protein ACWEG1_05855 [Streptomyces bauhiniae]